ncbi:MAG: hypothetical protein R3B45_18070, partial [Bdellovibrionota bacterium]
DRSEKEAYELRQLTERETSRIRELANQEVREQRARLVSEISQMKKTAEKELAEQLQKSKKEGEERLRKIELSLKVKEQEAKELREMTERETARIRELTNQEIQDRQKRLDSELHNKAMQVEAELQDKLSQMRTEAEQEIEEIRLETKRNVEEAHRKSKISAEKIIENAEEEARRIKFDTDAVKKELEENAQKEAKAYIESAQEEIRLTRQAAEAYAKETKERAEQEYHELKTNTNRELANLKLKETEKINAWKAQQEKEFHELKQHEINEIIRNLEIIIHQKIQEYTQSGNINEKANEIGAEVINITRQILNKEEAAPHLSQVQQLLPFNPNAQRKVRIFWLKVVSSSIAALTLITVLFIYPGYWKNISKSFKNYMETKEDNTDEYVKRVKADRKIKMTYNPDMTKTYKSTYTDNIIFTQDYIHTMTKDENFQKKWTKELNAFFKDTLDLDERVTVKFMVIEDALIKKLISMRISIKPATKHSAILNMRKEEALAIKNMKKLMKGTKNYIRFATFRKKFYEDYKNTQK